MKMIIKILTILFVITAVRLLCAEDGGVVLNCRPIAARNFMSASVIESGGRISKVRTRVEGNGSALVKTQFDGKVKMESIKRRTTGNNYCQPGLPVNFEDIKTFGIPPGAPRAPIKIGESWRQRFTLLYDGDEIPVTISYTLEKIDKLVGKEVAVIGFVMSGLSAGGRGVRWAGVGREVWDAADMIPILRIVEIKRGRSFVEDVDMKLSYSESLLF